MLKLNRGAFQDLWTDYAIANLEQLRTEGYELYVYRADNEIQGALLTMDNRVIPNLEQPALYLSQLESLQTGQGFKLLGFALALSQAKGYGGWLFGRPAPQSLDYYLRLGAQPVPGYEKYYYINPDIIPDKWLRWLR